jgi:hypothetical protein
MFTTSCSKCGSRVRTNVSNASVTCQCGNKVSMDNAICDHHKEKGQCDNPRCEFGKK